MPATYQDDGFYPASEAYWQGVAALAQLKPDLETGMIDRDEIVFALGAMNVWPASVLDDPHREEA